MLDNQKMYTGWKKWTPTIDEWVEFSSTRTAPFTLLENEYLLVYNDDGKLTEQFIMKSNKLEKIGRSSIKVGFEQEKDTSTEETSGKKRKSERKYTKGKNIVINPKNDEQVCAIDLLKDSSVTIKLLEGSFGVGKSMLMINAALEALAQGKFDQIVWIRNNIDCIGTKDLGAMPGDLIEKNYMWLGPIIDHAGEAAVKTMLTKETLKVVPLQYLRGRNFENSLIICTEAENLLLTNIQLIIARAADGSEVWFDGDYHQADKRIFAESDGLNTMKEIFKGNKLFGCVRLTKSERSATAAMANLLDEKVAEQKAKLLNLKK